MDPQKLSKDSNVHVTLLEARDYLGGRVITHRNLIPPDLETTGLVPQGSSDIAFDFGASWIHGVDPANPLMPFLKSGHVEYAHTDSDIMWFRRDRNRCGTSSRGQDRSTIEATAPLPVEESDHYWQVTWDIFDLAKEYAERHREQIPEDLSLKQWLTQYLASKQSHDPEGKDYMSKQDKRIVPALALYWADENAIPMDKVSMKYLDAERIFPGDHSLVINGFDRVVKVLASEIKGVRVLLQHVVERIEYNEAGVSVVTDNGVFSADRVLVTLPLGVLKAQSTTLFSPPLPSTKQLAIERLGFGTMFKIILFFPTCFWPADKHFLNFLPISSSEFSSPSPKPDPVLMAHFKLNTHQIEALTAYMQDLANYSSLMPHFNIPILIGYATNRAAELMERLSDEEARSVYICQLAHYFDTLLDPKQQDSLLPKVSFMTRWNQDPFARGSYASIPVGASQQDLEVFEIPVSAREYSQLEGDDDYEDEGNSIVNESGEAGGSAIWMAVDDPDQGRIFFAGEHTSPDHFASVHGAMMSGYREAARILGQHS
ncbi:hypothetical protein BGZ51_001480 [Haplosporangium sp. Z 767]|nr:hypothetical protein BGZ51_001480 [Haplosporangium sp. Z 767]